MIAHWTMGRRAMLGHLAAAVAAAPGAAWAGRDLLDTPAFRSARAASSLLLGVARAGDRVVAVGERGIIVWSDDAGGSWRQAAVPVSVTLTAVHFPTPGLGWAVGHDGVILHSADSGASWTKQFDGTRANALVAEDARRRLEAARSEGADALAAAETAMEDAEAAGEFGPSRPLLGVRFRDGVEGFAVGSYGQIFHTKDAGRSWRSLAPRLNNPEGFHYNAVATGPDGALLIAGEGGRVHRSADGGERWESFETGTPTSLYGVRALPAGAGPGGLLGYGFGGRIFRWNGEGGCEPVPSPTTRTVIGSVERGPDLVLVDAAGACHATADSGRSFSTLRLAGALPVAAAVAAGTGTLIQVGMGGARAVPLAA